MKLWVLLREGLATTWANKVPTALVAFLVAVMVASTLATVGRTAAAENQLEERMDAAGSRLLTVIESRPKDLMGPAIIAQTAGLSTVERAVGTVSPIDTVNGAVGQGAQRVATWGIVGEISAVAELTQGRWPQPGEALVSAQAMTALGLTTPFGWVAEVGTPSTSEFTIVGSFTAREPFTDYDAGIIYNAAGQHAQMLSVILTDARQAAPTQRAVLALLAPEEPTDITVNSPIALSALRGQVLGDFGAFGRTLLLGVLGAGSVLIAIVVLADVLVRRADLGRRRALGATRGTIIGIVTTRTIIPALLGAALGTGTGIYLAQRSGITPPTSFTVGVATLAILAAAASAIPPALFAAARDPVAVLRTP